MKEDAKKADKEVAEARVQEIVANRMQAICDTLNKLGIKAEVIDSAGSVAKAGAKEGAEEHTGSVPMRKLLRKGRGCNE